FRFLLEMSSSDDPEWRVVHLHEFCSEIEEYCEHELMLVGLNRAFNYLDEKCSPNNGWRNKEKYGYKKVQYLCFICLNLIELLDHGIGIYKSNEKGGKKKAYIIHDTCLSSISMDKPAVLPAIETLIADKKSKKEIEKYCIFESSRICADCNGTGKEAFVSRQEERILNCSDQFCNLSYHWGCALKNHSCTIDYYDKTVFCKIHEVNDMSNRGTLTSQSPATHQNCIVCFHPVARWPMVRKIFYVECCDSFIHYDCVISKFTRGKMRCPCGSMNLFLASIQRQEQSLFPFSEIMKEKRNRAKNRKREW
ncbi:hypothetical protein PENTCL1PPCAC_6766, partial [Pristionchus entomophagus]